MDSLTHVVLGGCIGEAVLGRKLGRKAMLWGAMAQSLPDIDFLAGLWMDLPNELIAHRGFTHSLLFALLAGWMLALAADRLHRPHDISFRTLSWFFWAELLTHLGLDACNNYGIGWFEPFSDLRISFNMVYVADPFLSVIPGIAFLMLLRKGLPRLSRRRWALAGILAPLLYLGYALVNKLTIDLSVPALAERQGLRHTRYFTTPAPLNNWLWFVVLEDAEGFHTGYRSVFDGQAPLTLRHVRRNDSLLEPVHDHEEVVLLKRFSQGYYTVEMKRDTLVFNDLRFGQEVGWEDSAGRFVFRYYLSHPHDNELIVQRGRFARWSMRTPTVLARRIFSGILFR